MKPTRAGTRKWQRPLLRRSARRIKELLLVVGLLSLLSTSNASAKDEPGPSCPTPQSAPLASSVAPPLPMEISEPDPFRFGRNDDPDTLRIPFKTEGTIPQPEVPLSLTVSDFRRQPSGRLPVERVVVSSVLRVSTGFVVICVDPLAGNAGEYDGIITVDDPRFQLTSFRVSVQLQWKYWGVILLLVLLAGLAGTLFKWAESQKKSGLSVFKQGMWFDMGGWLAARPVSLAVGFAGAVGVFLSQYWTNMAWDADLMRFSALAGAAFAAVVSALSGGDIAAPNTERKKSAEENARRRDAATKNPAYTRDEMTAG